MTSEDTVPALGWVLDAGRLSELLGRPVVPDYVRYKPGVSVLCRIREDDGGLGWVVGYTPHSVAKLDKVRQRAHTHGWHVQLRDVPDAPAGNCLAAGPLKLDGALYKPLQRLDDRAGTRLLVGGQTVEILNYNPGRRLVAATPAVPGPRVVLKVSSGRGTTEALLRRLAGSGVPVVQSVRPAGHARSKHVEYFPWVGEGNLLSRWQRNATYAVSTVRSGTAGLPAGTADDGAAACLTAAYRAGQALAAVHRVPVEPEDFRRRQHLFPHRLMTVAAAAGQVLPELAGRITAAAEKLSRQLRLEGPSVLIHGDFSADQVLVDGSAVHLIDFDRCSAGSAASDLGCFAAVESLTAGSPTFHSADGGPLTGSMLSGYQSAGGVVAMDQLRAWTGCHRLARLMLPFRNCEPGWAEAVERRLAAIEMILP